MGKVQSERHRLEQRGGPWCNWDPGEEVSGRRHCLYSVLNRMSTCRTFRRTHPIREKCGHASVNLGEAGDRDEPSLLGVQSKPQRL